MLDYSHLMEQKRTNALPALRQLTYQGEGLGGAEHLFYGGNIQKYATLQLQPHPN